MSDRQKHPYPPTREVEQRHGSETIRESHPSYGLISIGRVSGLANLFQSDVKHMYFISLRIKEAKRVIDGTHEHLMAGRQIAEVYMSEAQFAQMITQPNTGDGVACTIHDAIDGAPKLELGATEPKQLEAPRFCNGPSCTGCGGRVEARNNVL